MKRGAIRFSGHDKEGASMARDILRRLKYSNAVIDAVCAMVERHMRFMNVQQMKKSTLRMFMSAPHFSDELELHRLDCLSSNGLMDNWQFVRDAMDSYGTHPWCLLPLVTGRDLLDLGLPPGPDFRKWLSRLQELSWKERSGQEGGPADAGANCPGGTEYTCRVPGKVSIIGRKTSSFQLMRPVIYQLFVRHFSNMETHGVDWGPGRRTGAAPLTA